jgi:tRNA-dihydrouridine synthase C
VANGEIWTVADAQRCREISGCADIMIGRGMVVDPGLAWEIRRASGEQSIPTITSSRPPVTWQTIAPLINDFWQLIAPRVAPKHRAGRLKQWLNMLRRRHPEAQSYFSALRTVNDPVFVTEWLKSENQLRIEEFGVQ